eukprot:828773-Pyramimonas_sp.AAC.1
MPKRHGPRTSLPVRTARAVQIAPGKQGPTSARADDSTAQSRCLVWALRTYDLAFSHHLRS